jgi:ribosomal protein L13E
MGGEGKQPMTPKELAKLRKQVVDLERAAKADPGRAKELQAAQKAYATGADELKQQRKARAQEIKKDRGPGFGRGFGLGDDDERGRGR